MKKLPPREVDSNPQANPDAHEPHAEDVDLPANVVSLQSFAEGKKKNGKSGAPDAESGDAPQAQAEDPARTDVGSTISATIKCMVVRAMRFA